MTNTEPQYPVSEHLRKIHNERMAINEFIEWLYYNLRIELAEPCYEYTEPRLVSIHQSVDSLIMDFFEIDQERLEAERRAMLDAARAGNS